MISNAATNVTSSRKERQENTGVREVLHGFPKSPCGSLDSRQEVAGKAGRGERSGFPKHRALKYREKSGSDLSLVVLGFESLFLSG